MFIPATERGEATGIAPLLNLLVFTESLHSIGFKEHKSLMGLSRALADTIETNDYFKGFFNSVIFSLYPSSGWLTVERWLESLEMQFIA